jgi:Uma2 family endonuclease
MALRANPSKVEKTYTPEEFENMPEFQENYELVNGRLVKKPMAGDDHGRIARYINNIKNSGDLPSRAGHADESVDRKRYSDWRRYNTRF